MSRSGNLTALAVNGGTVPSPLKAAVAYKTNENAGFYNGVEQNSFTSTRNPTTVTEIGIGSQSFSSDGYLNGHIARFTYWGIRPTDEQLAEITG